MRKAFTFAEIILTFFIFISIFVIIKHYVTNPKDKILDLSNSKNAVEWSLSCSCANLDCHCRKDK